jgi:hypothetical protein
MYHTFINLMAKAQYLHYIMDADCFLPFLDNGYCSYLGYSNVHRGMLTFF